MNRILGYIRLWLLRKKWDRELKYIIAVTPKENPPDYLFEKGGIITTNQKPLDYTDFIKPRNEKDTQSNV